MNHSKSATRSVSKFFIPLMKFYSIKLTDNKVVSFISNIHISTSDHLKNYWTMQEWKSSFSFSQRHSTSLSSHGICGSSLLLQKLVELSQAKVVSKMVQKDSSGYWIICWWKDMWHGICLQMSSVLLENRWTIQVGEIISPS